MKSHKGHIFPLALFFLYLAIVASAIVLVVFPQYIHEWITGEKAVRIEQPKKYYELKIKELKMKLSPVSILPKYQVKSKCVICNFDFEPWKDDATHLISHGYCADCVIPFLREINLPVDSVIVEKVRVRMQIAIDWSV